MGDSKDEPRGLHYKYRVFREPDDVVAHPTEIMTAYEKANGLAGVVEEVGEFIFPLKPDSDHHARVALAAYAFSVSVDDPTLAEDLLDILSDLTGDNVRMGFETMGVREVSMSELFGGATPKAD